LGERVLAFTPGQSLGHYKIERLLGEGGMGAVYLAEDTTLHRKVALKVLPEDMASSPDRLVRFQREARAVAALNHPNIVTLFSVEEAHGTPFLTMELVEGTSLDRVVAAAPVPLAKVFDIGIALADALAAAHEKGIVHRDLKPANVMVTQEGRVKVLDFGLAKLAQAGAESEAGAPGAAARGTDDLPTRVPSGGLTREGLVIGTVPYMSPEQVRGEAVDARTDIFSLGVLLYELATGRRPFRGKSDAETISSILRDAPGPLAETRPDAPRDLQRILDHCLRKDPQERFQTARDIGNELRALHREVESGVAEQGAPKKSASARRRRGIGLVAAVVIPAVATLVFVARNRLATEAAHPPATTAAGPAAAAAAETDPHSIAVLPFVNMSADKEQEYFSDGISEELLNLLARIREIRVAARTSSFSFKGKDVEVPEIARQLHVAHVLEGSVRKSGNQVRITAQLIQASDGLSTWSQTYDRTLDDIFKIQDEIAADVVKELQVKLLGPTPHVRATDPQAYALYLQAVELGNQFTAAGFTKSDTLLRQALAIDPRYAPAWYRLGANADNEGTIGALPGAEAAARAREACQKAIAIDPEYAPAYSVLGEIAATYDNDLAGAARHLERALALDPRSPTTLGLAGSLLYLLGREDEALALMEAQVRRDPVNPAALTRLGISQRWAGRLDEAIATFRTLLNLNPGRGRTHEDCGMVLLLKGDADGALEEMKQEPIEAWRLIGLPMAYHALRRQADSDQALATLIAKYEKDAPYNIAYVYAYRGDADKAFEWLDKTVKYEDPGLSEIAVETFFDNIHPDPRWLPFLSRIGKDPGQLAKIPFKVTLPDER